MKFRIDYKGEVIGKGPLAQGDYRVGRGSHNWVFIKGPNFSLDGESIGELKEKSVTRLDDHEDRAHLRIAVSEDRLALTDTSTFGTYVRDKPIATFGITEVGTYRTRLGDVFAFDIIASE